MKTYRLAKRWKDNIQTKIEVEADVGESEHVKHHRGHHRSRCRHLSSPEESRLSTNSSWPKVSSHHSSMDPDNSDTKVHRHSKPLPGSRDRISTGHESRACNPSHGRARSNYFDTSHSPHRSPSPSYQRRPSSADPRFHRSLHGSIWFKEPVEQVKKIVQEDSPRVIEVVGPEPVLNSGSSNQCKGCADSRKKTTRTRSSDCKRAMSLSPSNIKYCDRREDILKGSQSCSKGVQTDQEQTPLGRSGHMFNSDASIQEVEKGRYKQEHRSRNLTRHTHSSRKKHVFDSSIFNNTDAEKQFASGNVDQEYQPKQIKDDKSWDRRKEEEEEEEEEDTTENQSCFINIEPNQEPRIKNPEKLTENNNPKRNNAKHGWLKPSTEPCFNISNVSNVSDRNLSFQCRKSQGLSNMKFNGGCAPKAGASSRKPNAENGSRNSPERKSDHDLRSLQSLTLNCSRGDNGTEETDNESESNTSGLSKPKKRIMPRTTCNKNRLFGAMKKTSVLKLPQSSHKLTRRAKFKSGQNMKIYGGTQTKEVENPPGQENYDQGKSRTWVVILTTIGAVLTFGVITLALLFYLPPSVFHWLFDFEEEEHSILLLPRLFGKSSV